MKSAELDSEKKKEEEEDDYKKDPEVEKQVDNAKAEIQHLKDNVNAQKKIIA